MILTFAIHPGRTVNPPQVWPNGKGQLILFVAFKEMCVRIEDNSAEERTVERFFFVKISLNIHDMYLICGLLSENFLFEVVFDSALHSVCV